ncbi:hypothetical protein BZG36_04544 [Bifiguratus adelaidae]|uniref:non-specific serine/threonine protein kinase n=1 Tax=Bifiguratus adelaidae TaxID=1938954 RepID=A0A261XV54_9FUNG|nr:hypothetical protein BZG36_04544 [Bifiguratus adelaidae]
MTVQAFDGVAVVPSSSTSSTGRDAKLQTSIDKFSPHALLSSPPFPVSPSAAKAHYESTDVRKSGHYRSRKQAMFGPYLLLQTVGEGEFGKVKLGIHVETGAETAVKLIKKEHVGTSSRLSKVEREILALRRVRHPNIVRLYDVIETERYIGIVLEYASGGELFEYILAHRYLKEKDACRLFAQLASGVDYLHKKKIIHRDLKLENLLLDRHRNMIITDFGFANDFEQRGDELMATSCGSPCYAAPELVVSDGMYVGSAVDIWSCGVILYAMLCGYLPYDDDPDNPDGENINLLYKYILTTPLVFPDYVSAEARDLCRRMLVADPTKRYTMVDIMRHRWVSTYRSLFAKTIDELEKEASEAPLLGLSNFGKEAFRVSEFREPQAPTMIREGHHHRVSMDQDALLEMGDSMTLAPGTSKNTLNASAASDDQPATADDHIPSAAASKAEPQAIENPLPLHITKATLKPAPEPTALSELLAPSTSFARRRMPSSSESGKTRPVTVFVESQSQSAHDILSSPLQSDVMSNRSYSESIQFRPVSNALLSPVLPKQRPIAFSTPSQPRGALASSSKATAIKRQSRGYSAEKFFKRLSSAGEASPRPTQSVSTSAAASFGNTKRESLPNARTSMVIADQPASTNRVLQSPRPPRMIFGRNRQKALSMGTKPEALERLDMHASPESGVENISSIATPKSPRSPPPLAASQSELTTIVVPSKTRSTGRKVIEWLKRKSHAVEPSQPTAPKSVSIPRANLSVHPGTQPLLPAGAKTGGSYRPAPTTDEKIRTHYGVFDKDALTSMAPLDIMADIRTTLTEMGIGHVQVHELKVLCTRPRRASAPPKSPRMDSFSARRLSATGSPLATFFRRGSHPLRRPNQPWTMPTIESSLNAPSSDAQRQLADEASQESNPALLTKPPTFADNEATRPPQPPSTLYGNATQDSGDEIRFHVEVCKVKHMPHLYVVDVHRIRGSIWSFKFIYGTLLRRLGLQQKGGYIPTRESISHLQGKLAPTHPATNRSDTWGMQSLIITK